MDMNLWSFGDALATGECLASTWDYYEIFLQQTIEDLKHKLTCTNMELEELRTNAHDELQKAKESIQQLIELLELRTSERDEARNQLWLLLNQIGQPSVAGFPRVLPHPPIDASQSLQAIGSSNISDNLSDTADPSQRYVSSPVESFVDATAVSSPELSSANVGDSCKGASASSMSKYHQASAVIDSLAMKGSRPERGRFVQAVLQAGPLLQTLMVAGKLPQWRNPPPPLRHLQVPPVAMIPTDNADRRASQVSCAVPAWNFS
ncbi:hypothetical protein OPV22_023539 [Ensete ventricosum]|uniref:Uncharacterized protein n=1 Tax=Ensete ventricosum TaxID=4639 RepID=A0AAV8QVS0_ENSVE|nr:hypothetical protein OPV22_023539 [Ensete ventricosum]